MSELRPAVAQGVKTCSYKLIRKENESKPFQVCRDRETYVCQQSIAVVLLVVLVLIDVDWQRYLGVRQIDELRAGDGKPRLEGVQVHLHTGESLCTMHSD